MSSTRALTRFDLLAGYMEWLHGRGLLDEHALGSFLTEGFGADDYVFAYCAETGYTAALRNEEVTTSSEYDAVMSFSEWLDHQDQGIMLAPYDPTYDPSHDELVVEFLKIVESQQTSQTVWHRVDSPGSLPIGPAAKS